MKNKDFIDPGILNFLDSLNTIPSTLTPKKTMYFILETFIKKLPERAIIVIWDKKLKNEVRNVHPAAFNIFINNFRIIDHKDSLSDEWLVLLENIYQKQSWVTYDIQLIRNLDMSVLTEHDMFIFCYPTSHPLNRLTLIQIKTGCVAIFWSRNTQAPSVIEYAANIAEFTVDAIMRAQQYAGKQAQLGRDLSDDEHIIDPLLESVLHQAKLNIQLSTGFFKLLDLVDYSSLPSSITTCWLKRYDDHEGIDRFCYFLTRDEISFLKNRYGENHAKKIIHSLRQPNLGIANGTAPYVGVSKTIGYFANWLSEASWNKSIYTKSLREIESKFLLGNVMFQVPIISEDKTEMIFVVSLDHLIDWTTRLMILEAVRNIEHSILSAIVLSDTNKKLLSLKTSMSDARSAVEGLKISGHVIKHWIDRVSNAFKQFKNESIPQNLENTDRALAWLHSSIKQMVNLGCDKREFLVSNPSIAENSFLLNTALEDAYSLIYYLDLTFYKSGCYDINIWGHNEYILYMFQELFTNARRHNPNPEKVVHVHIEKREKLVFLFIWDNGKGAKKLIGRYKYFEKETTERYGLNVIKRVVDLHAGTFGYLQSNHHGTIALIVLPINLGKLCVREAQKVKEETHLKFECELEKWKKGEQNIEKWESIIKFPDSKLIKEIINGKDSNHRR